MPSLTNRLQSLGVKVGARNLAPPKLAPREDHPIESVLPGKWWHTPHGNVFTVETKYKSNHKVGQVELKNSHPLDIIARWSGDLKTSDLKPEQFAFIDTETTGLAGGSGTYTFLIGVGRFEGNEFRLVQFFLHDPAEETAQLAALEEFLAPCEAIVSFNGKSFDIPLLNTRYILNGWPSPLKGTAQIDLLHLARRLWRYRLPSRSLGDLEVHILGTKRSEMDVPGWMVADLYFDYLHTGDARPLRNVFYHNEIDVVSLAALLTHMAGMLANPINFPSESGLEMVAIGKLYADLGFEDTSIDIYKQGLEQISNQDEIYWDALKQLSFIHKRKGDFAAACQLWKQAALYGQIYAHEELAKYFEHHKRNIKSALHWTETALELIEGKDIALMDRLLWQEAFEHRKNRLREKLERDLGNK